MKESNLSFKNIFKRETKLATYIILCVTVVVISSSYALFFQVNQNSKNQEVVAGDLVFTYENGETITGTGNEICFEPMTYEESTLFVSECGYRFSARNTGSLKASYTIKLVAKEENEIELSKLKVVLKKQNMETLEVVSGYPKLVSELENGVLIEEEVDPNSNIVYSVQIFFEEDLYEDRDINKKVMFEIVGSGLVHEEQDVNTDSSIASNYITNLAKTSEELVYDETVDNNLRYVGANPNNYVTFNNELWRIIGVMNNIKTNESDPGESRLKIIRNESIGEYSLASNNSNGANDWSESDLMKLLNSGYDQNTSFNYAGENILVNNSLYWNSLDGICYNNNNYSTASCDFLSTGLKSDESKSMIANTLWSLGGVGNWLNVENGLTKHFYNYERGTEQYDNSKALAWEGDIGLIYPSDYGFATAGGSTTTREKCLNTELYAWNSINECKENDWLKTISGYRWTMTPTTLNGRLLFAVYPDGSIGDSSSYYAFGVFPTLYLKSSVKIVDGDGSSNNPFLLSL